MQPLDFDSVATAWARWWPTFERGASAVSERLVAAARIRPGDRVLDLATGLGEPGILAARAAAPNGSVVAIDVSPAMLTLAAERARRENVANIAFVRADAAVYEPTERFDAIVSRWGLMFFEDLDAALHRFRMQLRDGGRFAAAVWGTPPEVPLISLPLAVAAKRFDRAAQPVAGGPFSLHDAGELRRRFRACGFVEVAVEDIAVVFPFESTDEYFEHVSAVAPPVVTLMQRLDEDERTAFRHAVKEAVTARFAAEDGSVSIGNRVTIVSAERGA